MPTRTSAAGAPTPPVSLPYDHIGALLDGWATHLRSRNKADSTIASYLHCSRAMLAFFAEKGMPQTVDAVSREHIEAFIADLLERVSPATAAKHYRSVQQLFVFLVDDGEMDASPMARMKPPKVTQKLIPLVREDAYKRLLSVCEGQTFENRRDTALITFMYDSGCRVGEIVGMDLSDYDPTLKRVSVVGKGDRPRNVGVGKETMDAFRRYLNRRQREAQAKHTDAFWIGRKGRLTVSGIEQLVERRCMEAGIARIHPHQFRHTFCHNWLADGGNETDLMSAAGWLSRDMPGRYAKSAAAERAQEAHRRLSGADRVAAKGRR